MISTLDTLEVVKELRAAGFNEEQAEAVTRVVRKAQELDLSDLATKADIGDVKAELNDLKADLHELRIATKADLGEVRAELKTEIAQVRSHIKSAVADLLKCFVGIAFAEIAAIVALIKFVLGHA